MVLERRPGKGHASTVPRKRAIIVGAGDVAEALVREIHRGALPYTVCGLVTDEPLLRGRRLHGVGVVGEIDDLPRAVRAARTSPRF